ncbi:MAG: hypothetical protein JW843_11270 [Candidatus Aminicenantes bacterium]|nr:hypothetical protein [Candidatus Aminicenantes bacterium]
MVKAKKFGFVALAGILIIAFIFLGGGFLQGQAKNMGKPKPPVPTYSWTVNLMEGGNLYGGPFKNCSTATVNVTKISTRDAGIISSFYVIVYDTNPDKLYFQNFSFDPDSYVPGEGLACGFPDSGSSAPDCLATYLNSMPHPIVESSVVISFSAPFDIDEMGEYSTWPLAETNWFNISLNNSLPYHDVRAHECLKNASLSRHGDTWSLNFDQKLLFEEIYVETVKKNKFNSYYPISVNTLGNFVCQSVWTRNLITE